MPGIFGSNTSVLTPHAAFGSGRGGEAFPSPWFDMATMSMPDSNKNALQWAEYVFQLNGTYRMAQQRIVSYFLTDVEFGSTDPRRPVGADEEEKYKTFCLNAGLLDTIQNMDMDRACYGNGFASMIVPFKRFLVCPNNKCGSQFTVREMSEHRSNFNYSFTDCEWHATCPSCKTSGKWQANDQPEDLENKLRVKIWSPHEIEIIHDLFTGDNAYVWRIPEEYKRSVRNGEVFTLERAPLAVIEAVKKNYVFMFAPDAIFHMREQVPGGVRSRGWGISRVLTNFRDVWYVQCLRRMNEAIALDYLIPFRVITPDSKGGGGVSAETGDILRITDYGDFSTQMRRMLSRHRQNPATWHTLPFPIKYQALGGEATQLVPRDLMDEGQERLLNSIGTPMEMYRGTLQLQTAPVSTRLFEATHHGLVYDNNAFLRWFGRQVSQILSWEQVVMRMKRVTFSDDFEKQMALLQLMMGQTISQTTALKTLGVEYKDEQRQIAEEARYSQQLQSEIQEEMEQTAFGEQIAKGQPPAAIMAQQQGGAPGGAPMAGAAGQQAAMAPGMSGGAGGMGIVGGMNVPTTPEDMLSTAESLAQQLLGLPETQKNQELHALEEKNEALHAIVKAKLSQIRQQARTAGGSMMMGQQGAAPAA